jgi:hypothetical protein
MKKFFTLFFFSAVAVLKADPTDTLGVSPGSTPQFAPNNQIAIVPYAGGYAFGTNGDAVNNFVSVGQGYVNDEPVYVGGALAFVAKKGKGPNNVPNTKITFRLHNIIPTGCLDLVNPGGSIPGPATTILASKDLFFEEIDTAFSAYSGVTFDTPVQVTGDLAISIDFSSLKTAGDTIGLYCDNVGSAGGLNYAFHQASIPGSPVWVSSNQVFQGALDNNVAIFPVLVDVSSNGEIDFQGVKTTVFPNPTSDVLQISLEGEQGKFTVRLTNMHGQLLESKNIQLNKNYKQLLDFNVSNLSNGQYLVLIEGENGSRMARQVIITR